MIINAKFIEVLSEILKLLPKNLNDLLFEIALNYLPIGIIKKIPCSYSAYLKCYLPKRGDVILDCGAHIGNCSILFSRLVGEKGLVIALEPFKDSFEILKKRIKRLRKKNILPVNKGVWDQNGKFQLEISENTISCKLIGNYEQKISLQKNSYSTIDCIRIDDLVTNLKLDRLDFIKMDIEGAEIEALLSAENTLRRYVPIIAIASYHIRGGAQTSHKVENILEEQAYSTETFFSPHLTTCGKKLVK